MRELRPVVGGKGRRSLVFEPALIGHVCGDGRARAGEISRVDVHGRQAQDGPSTPILGFRHIGGGGLVAAMRGYEFAFLVEDLPQPAEEREPGLVRLVGILFVCGQGGVDCFQVHYFFSSTTFLPSSISLRAQKPQWYRASDSDTRPLPNISLIVPRYGSKMPAPR